MTRLIVFKGGNTDFNLIDELNERVDAFIEDREVVSTNVIEVGKYLLVYVYYKDIPWTK